MVTDTALKTPFLEYISSSYVSIPFFLTYHTFILSWVLHYSSLVETPVNVNIL